MLFRPARRPRLQLLMRAIASRLTSSHRPDDSADIAYLACLSDERLERDLGLLRRADRDYRPY